MSSLATIKTELRKLLDKANEKTGKADADLTAAVGSLSDGYGSGGELQEKVVYPSHDEQAIAPDEDYYGLAVVAVKPVPRVPACEVRVSGDSGDIVEIPVNIGVETEIIAEDYITKYFRLTITDFRRSGSQADYASVAEFAIYDTNGNNIARSNGTQVYTANTYESSNETANKAFDGNVSTMWHALCSAHNTTNWLQVAIPMPPDISGFGITPRNNYSDFPWAFTFAVSDDENSWTILYEHSGTDSGWSRGVERLFTL